MNIKYTIIHNGEPAAGFLPFSDMVTIFVKSGDPGGEDGEFRDYMKQCLAEWYDGAKVYLEKEVE